MPDFASVLRLLWWLVSRWGKYGNAAVIHDYCYWEQRFFRKESDMIFREGMKVLGVSKFKTLLMYYAVRLGGRRAWRGNKRKKEKCIGRIAARMPEESAEVVTALQAER